MRYDTKTMREMVDAAQGETVAMGKIDLGNLLDAVARGQRAEDDLATMRRVLIGAGTTAAAA